MYRNVDLQVWLVTRPVSLVHPMVQLHTSLLFNTFTISSFVSFTIFSSTSFTIFSSITFTIFRGFVAAEKQKKKEDKDREARNCRLPPHHTSQISQNNVTNFTIVFVNLQISQINKSQSSSNRFASTASNASLIKVSSLLLSCGFCPQCASSAECFVHLVSHAFSHLILNDKTVLDSGHLVS